MRTTRLLAAVAAAGFVLSTGAAYANVITTSATYPSFKTDVIPAQQSKSLDLFDSSLGTLTSVGISVDYGFNSTLTVANSPTASSTSTGSAFSQSAAAFSSGNTGINSVLNSLINTIPPPTIGGKTLNPAAIDTTSSALKYSLAPGASQSGSVLGAIKSATNTTTNNSDLALFETLGGGTFDVGLTTLTGTVLGNTGGNASAVQVTTANADVKVTYNYTKTPVPEPSSLLLLGTGLLGLGAVGLRRRKAG